MPTQIIVTKRSDDYHACIAGKRGLWDCGKSEAAAIGALVLTHSEAFNVEITLSDGSKNSWSTRPAEETQ